MSASRRAPVPLGAAPAAEAQGKAPDVPPRLLLLGPPGSGKSRAALAAFDDALERFGPDAALLVLPTYGEVEHHKRLAISRREERRDARAILDASYVTFTSLGERLSPGFRVRALPSRRERDLLAAEALRRAAVPAFQAVEDRPGFRARFLRLVKEMKQTGEDPARLREASRALATQLAGAAARERMTGFLDVWEVYDGLLVEAGFPDHEDVLRELAGSIRAAAGTASKIRFLAVDGFEDLTGVESALLFAVADGVTRAGGHVLVTLPWDAARPELFAAAKGQRDALAGAGFVEQALGAFRRSEDPALSRLASHLFRETRGAGVPRQDPGKALVGLVATDDADEIDRIGREILRLRREEPDVVRSFRDVGVVFRRLDGIGPAARRGLEALGIPARLVGAGARLSSEAVARAVRGPLRLLAGDDGTEDRDFDALLLLDYLRWKALASGDPVPLDAVDRIDLEWRTSQLPADWAGARRALLEAGPAMRAVADDLERRRVEASSLSGAGPVWALIEESIEAWLPLPPSRGLSDDGKPVDPEGDERLRRAVAAKGRLVALAREAARAAVRTRLTGSVGVRDAVLDLEVAADEATSEPQDRRLDAVHLLDAEEARHWELPVVFVAGLAEGSFPLHPREDVFLRDLDREDLRRRMGDAGPAWRTARDAEDGERRLFLFAATRARKRLYLTRAAADEDGRERAPSFFWRDVGDALGVGANEPDVLGQAPDDLGRLHPAPASALSRRDLLRFATAKLGGLARPVAEEERDRVLAVALLRTGGPEVADVVRRAGRFWKVKADVLDASAKALFAASVDVVSPSSLNAGRSCLHRHFLTRIAGIKEDDAPFRGPTFDRRHFGTWVHEALKAVGADPSASPADVAKAVLEAAASKIQDAGTRAWAEEELTRILALFRDREAARAEDGFTTRPGDLEYAFGGPGAEVRLGSGEGSFRLKGTIDRIDVSTGKGASRAVVIDYKTSVSSARGAAKEMQEADDLQLPLYARAIENPRGVRVVALEHYAAARRERRITADEAALVRWTIRAEGGRARLLTPSDFRDVILSAERIAEEIVRNVRAGSHLKKPRDAGRCLRCPVLFVCRPDTSLFPSEPQDDSGGAP